MAHWQSAPADRFLTIRYEDLVADFDRAARDLVRFCGLEWQEACRRLLGGATGSFATMSTVQARRPLTRFSGRRDRYARHLSPLVVGLRDARVDLASGEVVRESST